MSKHKGPLYGVELIDELPVGGCTQAMPGPHELREVAKRNQRVVAGYEVLLAHYYEAMQQVEKLQAKLKDQEENARLGAVIKSLHALIADEMIVGIDLTPVADAAIEVYDLLGPEITSIRISEAGGLTAALTDAALKVHEIKQGRNCG